MVKFKGLEPFKFLFLFPQEIHATYTSRMNILITYNRRAHQTTVS